MFPSPFPAFHSIALAISLTILNFPIFTNLLFLPIFHLLCFYGLRQPVIFRRMNSYKNKSLYEFSCFIIFHFLSLALLVSVKPCLMIDVSSYLNILRTVKLILLMQKDGDNATCIWLLAPWDWLLAEPERTYLFYQWRKPHSFIKTTAIIHHSF